MGKEGERVESVGGSYELKNLEGDEVFEEAVGAVKRLDDQGDVVVGNVNVDGVADNAEELDKFQDSIEVSGEGVEHLIEEEVEVIDTQEVPGEDKPGQLYSSCLDGIAEIDGGVSCDESYIIRDDSSGGKELSDLNTDRSRVFQEGRDLVNGNFGLSSEKNEDEDLVNGNYGLSSEKNQDEDLEYVTPRQNGGVISKTGSTGKVEDAVDGFNIEFCSDTGCLKGGGLDPDLRDEKIEEQCHASGDSCNEIQDDTVERSVEMEDDFIDTDIIDSDTNGQEMGISDATEDDHAGSNSEHLEIISEAGGSSPVVDENKVIETAESSFLSETSFANEMKAVQATAADPEEGNTKVYLSKISNEENQGNYDKSFVVQEPEKIPENNANEKQTTQIANEHQLDFLSGKPVATSTPLDHPVGLRSTTPLLKPAPRAMQQPTDIIEKQNRISNKNLNFQKKLLTVAHHHFVLTILPPICSDKKCSGVNRRSNY